MPNNIIDVVVSALIIDEEDRIFLIRYPKWSNWWAIPGGKVNYGESLRDALKREIIEETGLRIRKAELIRVSESIFDKTFLSGTKHMILIDFVCNEFKSKVKIDNREAKDYVWIDIKDALNQLKLTPPTRETIKLYFEKFKKTEE